MTLSSQLASDKPRSADPAAERVCAGLGPVAAWRQAARASGIRDAAASAAGEFSVAWADGTGDSAMAIDRFGIRTLCYRQVGGELRFAERADELADADTELDPQAIFDYLYFHNIPSPRTIFKGISRLPPGHCGEVRNGQLEVKPYWVPRFDEPRGPVSFDDLKERFLELLRKAIERQLDGSQPACYLSGGTDSSTVAGIASQVTGRPAATFSIGFDAEGYDEMNYARITARRFGTEHHEYYVSPDDLIRSIPHVAGSYDQPFGNSSALPAYYCALMAREKGVTHILAGDGGDELFGGNARYAKQRLFDAYGHLPRALRRGLLEPVFGAQAMGRIPLLKKGASYIEQARRPMPDRLEIYNLLGRIGYEEVLSADFLAAVDTAGPLRQQRDVWAAAETASDLNRTLAFDWRYTLADSDLPKVRGTAQLAGLSVGFPLLDDELVEFSMMLPPSYKLRGQQLRWFFKEALRGFLPDETLTKRKQGFGLPFGFWLMRHAGLKALAADSLHGIATRGIVREEFIEVLLRSKLEEHPRYYGEMVWILMMLEQWLRRHRPGYKL